MKARPLKNWVQERLAEDPGILSPYGLHPWGPLRVCFSAIRREKFASEEEVGDSVIPTEASSRETDTPKPLWWPQQSWPRQTLR